MDLLVMQPTAVTSPRVMQSVEGGDYMSHVLAVLDALHATHDTWFYRVRDHFKLNLEYYNIDLVIDGGHRIVVSSAPTEDYVEVWCDTHDSQDDGVRVKKSALLEYLLYIIQEEYGE